MKIERRKVRADFGITYDADTFKLIDDLRERGLDLRAVVITRYQDQPAAETFPIWNLPLRHPVNAAYEEATAELRDVNMIDPFHLETYDERAVNYNRDVEAFPLLKRILEKITGESMYNSPTDMGVNRAGFAIIDDDEAREAGK